MPFMFYANLDGLEVKAPLQIAKPEPVPQVHTFADIQDPRKRRRARRRAARRLINGGTFLNSKAAVGSAPWMVAQWHLKMARRGK